MFQYYINLKPYQDVYDTRVTGYSRVWIDGYPLWNQFLKQSDQEIILGIERQQSTRNFINLEISLTSLQFKSVIILKGGDSTLDSRGDNCLDKLLINNDISGNQYQYVRGESTGISVLDNCLDGSMSIDLDSGFFQESYLFSPQLTDPSANIDFLDTSGTTIDGLIWLHSNKSGVVWDLSGVNVSWDSDSQLITVDTSGGQGGGNSGIKDVSGTIYSCSDCWIHLGIIQDTSGAEIYYQGERHLQLLWNHGV